MQPSLLQHYPNPQDGICSALSKSLDICLESHGGVVTAFSLSGVRASLTGSQRASSFLHSPLSLSTFSAAFYTMKLVVMNSEMRLCTRDLSFPRVPTALPRSLVWKSLAQLDTPSHTTHVAR